MKYNKPNVLLIDDNETDNLISRKVLETAGFADSIHVCTSGKSALEYLENRLVEPEKLPDLLFLDINMPLVDGFLFLEEFEKLAARTKKNMEVIVLSSSDSAEDINNMAGYPSVIKFITKPMTSGIVKGLIAA